MKNWLFVCTGTLLLAGGLLGAALTARWVHTAEHAPGRVLREDHGPAHVTVEFVDRRGRRVAYPQNGLVALHKGEQVEVLYHADDPSGACVNQWCALYSGVMVALSIGAFHLFGGLQGLAESKQV